jgi:hypothetical protein
MKRAERLLARHRFITFTNVAPICHPAFAFGREITLARQDKSDSKWFVSKNNSSFIPHTEEV